MHIEIACFEDALHALVPVESDVRYTLVVLMPEMLHQPCFSYLSDNTQKPTECWCEIAQKSG